MKGKGPSQADICQAWLEHVLETVRATPSVTSRLPAMPSAPAPPPAMPPPAPSATAHAARPPTAPNSVAAVAKGAARGALILELAAVQRPCERFWTP